MQNNQPLLSVKNLSVKFGGATVVNKINFEIFLGQTLALVGESGSGKSLTALAIMQLLPLAAKLDPNSCIYLEGEDLLHKSELMMQKIRGSEISMVFQEAITALNPVLTIGHQIDEVLKAHKRVRSHQRIIECLTEVGISDPEQCAVSYPHQLSGGMKQRAMIAIALAAEPKLLIADEPTTALDVTIQAQVLELMQNIQKKRGMSVLFITHDIGIVKKIADHVVVMKEGDIVEQKSVASFFQNPEHEYSKHLFNSIPSAAIREREIITEHRDSVLVAQDLKIHYPIKKGIFKRVVGYVKAVDGVSFELQAGKTLALVGESGSGKTTAGLGVLDLLRITSGSIKYQNGAELNRKDYQIIFQDPYSSMNPRMMIADIISEGMRAQKLPVTTAKIDELLTMVGLEPEYKYRYPHEFSGGQRQRICIARALALEPKVLICDEPTSALDVSVQMHILKLMVKLQQKLDLSYLLITHDFSVVSYLADEVAVMHHGKIVEQGEVETILKSPQHEYTKKLLASVPIIETALPKVQEEVTNDRIC